jgi:hypothetical protein
MQFDRFGSVPLVCLRLLQAGSLEKSRAAYLNSCELLNVPEPLVAVAKVDLKQESEEGLNNAPPLPLLLQV